MQRRKFVIGLGALASGTAAAVGTGAFSSVNADRDFEFEVENDGDAYLRLDVEESNLGPEDGFESEYAEFDEMGRLNVTLDRLNPDAVTVFEELFLIGNTGEQGNVPVNIKAADGAEGAAVTEDGNIDTNVLDFVIQRQSFGGGSHHGDSLVDDTENFDGPSHRAIIAARINTEYVAEGETVIDKISVVAGQSDFE